jgi:hypothetical protein
MRGGLELRVDGLVKREASQVRIYAFKVRIYKAIASIGYFSPSLHYRDDQENYTCDGICLRVVPIR